jgi:hypothetical protein
MGIFTITLIVCSASLAMAGIPDASMCSAVREDTGGEKAIVFCVPGSAADHPFDLAVEDGNPFPAPQVIVDATIWVIIRDSAGTPIANVPAEDCWLRCPAGDNPPMDPDDHVGLVACPGGFIADLSTDGDGLTRFRNPKFGGGQSYGQTTVVVNGNGLPNTVDVSFNSTDINGDGVVNLIDLQLFTADFFDLTNYHFRSDFFYDQKVNLIDLPEMAKFYGSICP